MIRVAELMLRNPLTLAVEEPAQRAAARMRHRMLDVAPVVHDGSVVGLAWRDELEQTPLPLPVASHVRPGRRVSPSEPADAALTRGGDQDGPLMVVNEDGELLGVTWRAHLEAALRAEALTRWME